jgi:uncharacterized protein with von Willebrand factor type A (vWA) domain
MQYDLIGHETEGQGPIIIAIDESGSMTTDYGGMTGEVWSKAVMLALLSIARLQKRDLAVIHFSGPDDLRVDLLISSSTFRGLTQRFNSTFTIC